MSNSATIGKEDQSWKSSVSKMLRKRQSGKDLGRNVPNTRNSWYKDSEIKTKSETSQVRKIRVAVVNGGSEVQEMVRPRWE